MSVPDYRHVPRILYETGLFDLHTHEGQGAFTDVVISTLHGLDPQFRHLIKKPGQTAIHNHGEDAALYLFNDGSALAVDFIGGANGPNPQPAWMVGSHVYTHADAHDPEDHGIRDSAPPPPPPPPVQPYPDEPQWWGAIFTPAVIAEYAAVNRKFPDPHDATVTLDGFRHWSRTAYDIRNGMTKEAALAKRITELRGELGG